MILDCQNIEKSFGGDRLFSQISFHLEEKEKAALIGMNGAGKTTLLRIILGEESADAGQVVLSKGTSIGYLSQHQDYTADGTLYEALAEAKRPVLDMEEQIRQMEMEMRKLSGEELDRRMQAYAELTRRFELENGYACRSEIGGVLKGLGFTGEDGRKPFAALSGGQRTRVALGRLLLTRHDLILLDEPTNHLDMTSIAWLESFLASYPGAVLVVSHDRYFLDRFVTKVIGIENGRAAVFSGNYTHFSQKMEQVRKAEYAAYMKQQQEIRHQEEVIAKLQSFNREKSIRRAESRKKMLDKIEVLDKPVSETESMTLQLIPRYESGKDVLQIEDMTMGFDGENLFSHVSAQIRRGERVALIGNNGTGKTTLLKIINGLLAPLSGSFVLGSRVQIGYYDQEHQVLHMEKTIMEEISDDYPRLTQTQIRNTLAAFLFTGDEVFHQIGTLSGGERGRVSLAKLMLSEANFLILDEPTNHLDMVSKEILESALNQYTGTVLYVSHDRYFINRTASRILELTGQTLVNYIGDYDYYLEKRDEAAAAAGITESGTADAKGSADAEDSGLKNSWKQQKEEQARQRKRANDLKKTEEEIETLENRDKEIDGLLERDDVYTDVEKCTKLGEEKTGIAQRLEELYALWEELA